MQKHKTYKTCCFIGHRKIKITEELTKEIYDYVEHLIVCENVKRFLFGSKSEFDELCHRIITELKEKYREIKRVGYTCRGESVIKESEREKWEKIYSDIEKREVRLFGVEEEFEHKNKYVACKGAYIERNQAMIDDSDYCLFYYNEHYVAMQIENNVLLQIPPKSGTAIAYKYAKRKNKKIKNFYK